MPAAASTASVRPASQRTIWPQKRTKGESRPAARWPCCQLRVVSAAKTAVRPRPHDSTASTGMASGSDASAARTVAPGRALSTRVQPSSDGKPGVFGPPCRVGKKSPMFAKIGCRTPSGVSVGSSGSVDWPIPREPSTTGRASPSGVPA